MDQRRKTLKKLAEFVGNQVSSSKLQSLEAKGIVLGIIIGHEKNAQGAVNVITKETEYVYNTELAQMISAIAQDHGVNVFIETRDVGGVKEAFHRLLARKPKAIIELHFNAADGRATGTETLFSDDDDQSGVVEQLLAVIVNKKMSEALGLRNRGVKEVFSEGERCFYNISLRHDLPCILVEPGFGDNEIDALSMKQNKEALARAIVEGFIKWVSYDLGDF